MSFQLLVFDFDNVLIDGYQIVELAKIVGKLSEMEQLMIAAYEDPSQFITSHMNAISLLKGLTLAEVYNTSTAFKIMKGAVQIVKWAKKLNLEIAVISNGYIETCEFAAKGLGINWVYANQLLFLDGVSTGEMIPEVADPLSKATNLKKLLQILSFKQEECIVIGDGLNDWPMMQIAGLSVAFNAHPELENLADISVRSKDLTDVVERLVSYCE
ncbi:MAG: phosphoserine phosphatase SerB [Saprospiraceae bacterium]